MLHTYDEALEVITQIVDEAAEGAKNPVCEYSTQKSPGKLVPVCIAGQVLDRFGLLDIVRFDGPQILDADESEAREAFEEHFEPDAVTFLGRVQVQADRNMPWADALRLVLADDDEATEFIDTDH